MEKTLDDLIRDAAKRAAKNLHRQGGQPITFIGYRADGEIGFMIDQQTMLELGIGPATDGRFVAYTVKNFLSVLGCIQVVCIAEAWKIKTENDGRSLEQIRAEEPDGLVNHPARVDVIHFSAEDFEGNRRIADQSVIRPAGAKPYLDNDLTIQDGQGSEGDMLNLFDKSAGDGIRNAIHAARQRMAGAGRWVDA